eukprot:TRINITY_DN15054_c0_g2_i1.p1 TRINITY_DN15054_c0_g2~~TRINITY_DN15054_c0_g2_i1.p1  ORF type:complete len:443 (-),score=75.45 TRINITY_DN15054_c0_g2_i1:73-1401(-)
MGLVVGRPGRPPGTECCAVRGNDEVSPAAVVRLPPSITVAPVATSLVEADAAPAVTQPGAVSRDVEREEQSLERRSCERSACSSGFCAGSREGLGSLGSQDVGTSRHRENERDASRGGLRGEASASGCHPVLGGVCFGEAHSADAPSLWGGLEADGPTDDGGTGGTGSSSTQAPRARRDCTSQLGTRGFTELIGASERPADPGAAGRQALVGEKALRPRILRLRALRDELETLGQTRQQTSGGDNVLVPHALEAATSDGEMLCLSDWVRRLLYHEASFKGVPARSVKEACSSVLGTTSRLISLGEVKEHYAAIHGAVDRLARERIDTARLEQDALELEVSKLEDFIALCFEKMDSSGHGVITRQEFVDFLRGRDCGERLAAEGVADISEEDADTLFDVIAKGGSEFSLETFRDEVTTGCLQVLRCNIALRRNLLKKFRDYWF